MYNPFTSLIPEGYDLNLLGRKGYLRELDNKCSGKTILNYRYISPRGTGKSTLLRHYFSPEKCRELAREHKLVRMCCFSGDEMRTDAEVFVRLINAVMDSLKNLGPDSDAYKELYLALEGMKKAYPQYPADANLGELVLKDMLCYLQEEKYSVTLVLDEFHRMSCSPLLAESTFSKMSRLSQYDKLISYIVASDYDDDVGSSTYYMSGFTRIFNDPPVHVQGIEKKRDRKHLIEVIRGKLADEEEVTFSDEELKTILELTGGIPDLVRCTLKDIYQIKQELYEEMEEPCGELDLEQIGKYALSACTPLFEKWVRYLNEDKWNSLEAMIQYETIEGAKAHLEHEHDKRTSLVEAGLMIPDLPHQVYRAVCPLFGTYLKDEFARRASGKPAEVVVEEKPRVDITVINVMQNTGPGNMSVEQKQLFQNTSVPQLLEKIGSAGGTALRSILAQSLSDRLRERLAPGSFPRLLHSEYPTQEQYEQAYDEAFSSYSQNLVEELSVIQDQMRTMEQQFIQARDRTRPELTDAILAGQSERCQFYMKLSVVIEDTLALSGIRMDDYSPHLVLYGKALEQSLRDHFFPLFNQEANLSVTNLQNGKSDNKNCFGKKTLTKAFIAAYIDLIEVRKEYLAQLCLDHQVDMEQKPVDQNAWIAWWDQLKQDIEAAKDIRNKADHADQQSPDSSHLNNIFRYLVGDGTNPGILVRNRVGSRLKALLIPDGNDPAVSVT